MWKVRELYIPTDIDIGFDDNDNVSVYDFSEYKIPQVGVYVYLSEVCCLENIAMPDFEKEYIKTGVNEKIIGQKMTAYALLKYAVKDVWGIDEDFSSFKKTDNGKPYTDKYKFSISHSNGVVCVAVSKVDVGVDVEVVSKGRHWEQLTRKILNDNEQRNNIDVRQLTELWTKKEAIFKMLGDRIFVPKNIDVNLYNTDCIKLKNYYDNSEYVLSVATHTKTDNYLTMCKVEQI